MPSCSGRNLLYGFMALQLLSTLERQVFDFMGYMWVPILANFLHTVIVILGIFGVYQYTSKHLMTYLSWNFIWSAFNAFIICYYLEVGGLDTKTDLLAFGTGSYSWWMVNGLGCQAEFFPANETALDLAFGEPQPKTYRPLRPSKVVGCLISFEYVEVIHAGIQIGLAVMAVIFGVPLAHYLVTVVEPKYRKAKKGQKRPLENGHAMYSIEYSQVNETINNTQETDFYANVEGQAVANGEVRPHMTPRRVKRRSYTRSSARSASKALKKETSTHRQSGRSVRSAAGALGASMKATAKVVNPVTRLMQETDTHPVINDSSTSNDDGRTNVERYGQVNPGYVSSRPNSLYNGPQSITDYEASRPPSALTSYSNFHGQRRPMAGAPGPNQLTQESFNQYNNHAGGAAAIGATANHHNASFDDDLPPPPPPLSSSPSFAHRQVQNENDTDNNSSITTDTTAQMPVPLQRQIPNTRRNEYVNMPVNSHPMMPAQKNSNNGNHDLQSLSSASPDLSNHIPAHNYANMPVNKNPMPPPRSEDTGRTRPQFSKAYQQQEEPLGYNDTQTLRADQRLSFQQNKDILLSDETDASKPQNQQYRQVHLDYGMMSQSQPKAEPQQASRVPTGHMRRDRASLRAKHRQEMEQAKNQKMQQPIRSNYGNPEEDEYGFSKGGGAEALPNGHSGHNGNNDDKWYLHDSMRPVGAPSHGGNCKCYRCQRKLTAI